MNANNLAAVNSALNSAAIDANAADTTGEVQAIVDAYQAILASADGTVGNTSTPLTGNQYAQVGVTGLSGTSAPAQGSAGFLLNNVVDGKTRDAVDSVPELQTLADAATRVIAHAGGGAGTAPTLDDFGYLGLTNVTSANLGTAQSAIARSTAIGVDTLAELRAVVDSALTTPPPPNPSLPNITLSSALSGVTHLDVTSNLVFSAAQTLQIGTGTITITDLGGVNGTTGFRNDTQVNPTSVLGQAFEVKVEATV